MIHDTLPATDPYRRRRQRAHELQQRYDYAAEVLAFYEQLAGLQEAAFAEALVAPPAPSLAAHYAAEHVLPRVVQLSAQSGPPYLMQAVIERFHEADFADVIGRWLRSEDLSSIDRYLARAASAPVLEALGEDAAGACEGVQDERHCPRCGGLPQVSYFAVSGEDLVTAHRYLECARCAAAWAYARMTCAYCGETESAKLPVFDDVGEPSSFPHVRIDGCESCSRYLLNVDLSRDRQAVPAVDELAAIPLDLYAKERGLQKIVPNVMGF
jgi:FdhE protein